MSEFKNLFIDYNIIINSDIDKLKEELNLLIYANYRIYVWSKDVDLFLIEKNIKNIGLFDFIWGYKVKNSFNYSAVDFIIDNDEKLVNRFKRNGIPGNIVERI